MIRKRENSKVESSETIKAYEAPVVLPLGSAARSLGDVGCPPSGAAACRPNGSGACPPSGSDPDDR